ncbi:hypothetical protein HY572_04205 [Candidatus Micrarchaeota archaeon]|nr:hypothetical protein [Candidatus Micrarchaeota archaeon]
MDFRMTFLALVFASLLVLGCAQPAPADSSATPAPSLTASTTPEPSPSVAPPSSSSVAPSEKPSPLAQAKPSLSEFAFQVHKATSAAFNDTRDMREVSATLWVQDDFTSQYQYSVSVKRSVSRGWSAFDTVITLKGDEDGSSKEAAVKEEPSGTFYRYQATIKCFDASYDVDLDLRDYVQDLSGSLRKSLGAAVMAKLVSVCPD